MRRPTTTVVPAPLFRRLCFCLLNLVKDPSGLVLIYDSGSAAKLIRLGVDRPELGVLPPPKTDNMSGMLSTVGDGEGFALLVRFIEECLGGEGGRVDEECVPLVKRRDMEAVAVEVAASATGAGVRGKNAGAGGSLLLVG